MFRYLKIISGTVKDNLMVSRWSFVLNMLGSMISDIPALLMLLVLFDNIEGLNNWTLPDVMFIYLLAHFSFGIHGVFFAGFRAISKLVQEGDYDRILVTPINNLVYISAKNFRINSLSHVIFGVVVFIVFKNDFNIIWNIKNILLFICATISAGLVHAALTLFIQSISFFLLDVRSIQGIYVCMREFTWYPINLFHKIIQIVLFTIIPLAFVSFVPAGSLLKSDYYLFLPTWVWNSFLGIGVILFMLSLYIFKLCEKYYISTGN